MDVARSLPITLATIVVLASVLAPAAVADETVATVVRPTVLSGYGGSLVWSAFDPVSRSYRLMARTGGVTSPLPVAPRTVPFDVDLGPDRSGRTVAAYSRCRVEPAARRPALGNAMTQLPQWSRGRGCDLYRLDLASGREVRITSASSPRASEFLPSIWRGRVVFARRYERKHGRAGRRAYLYVRVLRGAGRTRRLPAGSRSSLRLCGPQHRPPRCPLTVEPGPTALDLAGSRLALGWDSGDQGGVTSSVYVETIGRRTVDKKLLDRQSSGDIQGAEMFSPLMAGVGRVLWEMTLFGDETSNRVRRYTLAINKLEEATIPAALDRFVRPTLGLASDSTELYYLLSGGRSSEPGCTPQTPCSVGPGCSESDPCAIRTATGLSFTRAPRR